MGRRARTTLRAGHGSVAASFESSLYIESETGIACLVPSSAYRGPLNVVLPDFRPGTPELHRAEWRADGTTLVVERLGSFSISPCEEWIPAGLQRASPCALRDGLAAMRAALARRAPRGEVLSHVPGSPPEHPSRRRRGASTVPGALEAHFARTLPALSRWLEALLSGQGASSSTPVTGLLGSGGGLTPSGDDCVVGVLVALRALGECDAASTVASLVARHAAHRTSRLSAAHLHAACDGEAIEPLHGVIEAIAAGVSPEPALDSLERFGHGSGFDALAGVLLAADAIARKFEPEARAHAPEGTLGMQATVHRQ